MKKFEDGKVIVIEKNPKIHVIIDDSEHSGRLSEVFNRIGVDTGEEVQIYFREKGVYIEMTDKKISIEIDVEKLIDEEHEQCLIKLTRLKRKLINLIKYIEKG